MGLTRINRVQLVADASNGLGWQHGGVEGVATEFVQIESVTLGTLESFSKPSATATLGNLAVTYDGTAKAVSVTTVPEGLSVDLTYNGSATVPTNAGSYVVVGKINDATYQGTALGTLVIDKAAATATIRNLTTTYNGAAKPVSVTTVPAGLTVNVTYDGSATAPTAAGSYAVVAVVDDVNYRRRSTGTLVISKATATVTMGDLATTFDGTPKAISATTVPAGLNVALTYDGSATAPSAAGSYPVVATINDANYQGTVSDTLVIGKATATITLGDLAATFDGTPKAVSATTVPAGLNVALTYDGSASAPSAAGSYPVVATINDANYQWTVSDTLVIGKAAATITLGDLAATFDGTPKAVSATTVPAGLNVALTYDGSATAPSAAGSYPVVATINDANYQGTASNTLVITESSTPTLADVLADQYSLTGVDAEPLADPDSDGVPNLLEYAFGSSPVLPASAPEATRLEIGANAVRFSAIVRNDSNLTVIPEFSADLTTWAAEGITELVIADVSQDGVPLGFTRRTWELQGVMPGLFLRWQVTYSE
jgi:hypothetical protein